MKFFCNWEYFFLLCIPIEDLIQVVNRFCIALFLLFYFISTIDLFKTLKNMNYNVE